MLFLTSSVGDAMRAARLRIGDWIADPATNEIVRGDEVVRLEPRTMDVLMALAAQPGAVVGREALFATVWAGMVVGDESLTQCVIKLRRALRDDARAPTYIEAIRKRGYRLIAPVMPETAPTLPPRPDRARRWIAATGATLTLAVAVALLGPSLLGTSGAPAQPPRGDSPSAEARAAFDRAQALVLVRRKAENDEARALYRRALDADPQFARAYAGLAMTYAMESRLAPARDAAPALDRALVLARTAEAIDPRIPEVHWVLGLVHAQARQHADAIADLRRAIELDPAYTDAYALLAGVYTYVGEPAQSIPLLRTAMRLKPSAGYLYHLLLGRAYLFENDPEQALINLRSAVLRNPVDVESRVYLAAALVAAGDRGAAGWEADEIRALWPGFSLRQWLRTYPIASEPAQQPLAALLAQVEL